MPVLLLVLQVLQMRALGDEELDHFGIPIAAGPDNGIPFLLSVLYIDSAVHWKLTSAFFFKHFSAYSISFFFTAPNIRSFSICLFFSVTSYSDSGSYYSMLSMGGCY